MIKGSYFGKLFLRVFTILLVGFIIGLGNFSSAVELSRTQRILEVGLTGYTSNLNSQYYNSFLTKGRFYTNYLGTSKSVVALDNSSLVWWANNGMLYLYDQNNYLPTQGFFNYIVSCDYFELGDDGLTGCTAAMSLDGTSSSIVSNFLGSIKLGDYVLYNRVISREPCGGYCTYDTFRYDLCYSSSIIGSSLCFVGNNSSYCRSNGEGYCPSVPFVNSQNLSGLTFGNLPYSFIADSPGINYGGSVEEGSQVVDGTTLSGNVYYLPCTYGSAKRYYENLGYSKNMCYAGITYTGTGIYMGVVNYGTGLSASDLWLEFPDVRAGGVVDSNFTSFTDFFVYWVSQYKSYKNGNTSVFDNVPFAIQYWLSNLDIFGGSYDNRSRIDYCDIVMGSDEHLFHEYQGSNKKNICSVSNLNDNGSNTNSGTIIGSDWGGMIGGSDLNLSGKTFTDGTTFMNSTFNDIKSYIRMPNKSDFGFGYLPGYIIIALMGLIVFRFLAH